jgi:hypothetical protein
MSPHMLGIDFLVFFSFISFPKHVFFFSFLLFFVFAVVLLIKKKKKGMQNDFFFDSLSNISCLFKLIFQSLCFMKCLYIYLR